jgi:phosphatidate phosphatase PAH1
VAALASGCGGGDGSGLVGGSGPASVDRFRVCDRAPAPATTSQGFDRPASLLVTTGEAHHTAIDAATVSDRPASVSARFTYGPVRADLEGEKVDVWLDDCSSEGQRVSTVTTDADGIAAATIDVTGLGHGEFALRFVVVGDGSAVTSTLTVVPRETPVIVFDVDGTLTTSDRELGRDLWADLENASYTPTARPGAAEATKLRSDQGYLIVYLTGRPSVLADRTRTWLDEQEMADGVLLLTESATESLPTESGVGDFKRTQINRLRDLGLEISGAYGNAETDIYAYATAGVPLDRTWILGPHGGQGGTLALGDGYTEHLENAGDEEAPAAALSR